MVEIESQIKGLGEEALFECGCGAAPPVHIRRSPGHQLETAHHLGRDRNGAALQQGDVRTGKALAYPGQRAENLRIFIRRFGQADQHALDSRQKSAEIE